MKIKSAGFCAALSTALVIGPIETAHSADVLPCAVRLVFKEVAQGTDVIYQLTFQYKNRTARPITAASVLMMNDATKVIGNAQADCTFDGAPLNAGDTGECAWPLQVVGNQLMASYGSAAWTDIVNDQLEKFQNVVRCDVVGHRYSK